MEAKDMSSTSQPLGQTQCKLIAFDMDGTMLNDTKHFDARCVEALEVAAQAGVVLSVNSGRSLAELSPYVNELQNVRYAICENGALIADRLSGDILSRTCFELEVAQDVIKCISEDDYVVQAFSEGYAHFEQGIIPHMDAFGMSAYIPLFLATSRELVDVAGHVMSGYLECEKLDLYWKTTPERDAAHERLAKLPVQIALSEANGLELSPQDCDKGVGLSKLAALLGIDMTSVAMIGDADNDIAALKAAAMSLVPANAHERAKAAAQLIVASNNEAGCAQAIHALIDGELDR